MIFLFLDIPFHLIYYLNMFTMNLILAKAVLITTAWHLYAVAEGGFIS